MIHGAFHFCVCSGQSICILCRGIIWRLPHIAFRLYVRSWRPTGGSVISNIAGHIPASVFSVKETRASLHFEKDDNHGAGFLLYLCAGVSVLTAFLFGLPGLGASCWRVDARSAGHPECLPCKNAICIWWVKCLKGDPSFWSWDFLVFLRAMKEAVRNSRP